MGRGGGGSGGSHGGGGGHFNYGSSRSGGHSRGGGRSSSNYSPVYRTSYYRPMTPLGGTLSIILAIIVIVASRDTNPASLCTLLGEPSNKNTYSGVTDISWESGKQERSVDIRYEADVIKSITAEVRTPEEVFDYQYYDEVGLFSLTGDGYESSVPVKLPTLAVVVLLVGVTGGICRVLWRHRRQKRTQEILNTPLDELADSVLKKYGEEDDA